MGKVNARLKRSYITVVSLILIFSALLLALILFCHGHFYGEEEFTDQMMRGFHFMYVYTIFSLILALVGLYGACKEKKWALIVFAVAMSLGCLFMISCIIRLQINRPQFRETRKMHYLSLLPLDNATESVVDSMRDLQTTFQCCGLDQGYTDWGYYIPESCLCVEDAVNPCVVAPEDSDLFENVFDGKFVMIYNESCLPHVSAWEKQVESVVLGVLSGTTLFWMFSVLLCVFILCRLNKKEETHVVVFSQEAKAGNYAALAEPAEFT